MHDRFMLGGGAATSVPVMEFFEDIGVPICEGYGLTETCSYTHTKIFAITVVFDNDYNIIYICIYI